MYYQTKEPGGTAYQVTFDSTIVTTAPTSIFRLQAGASTRVLIEEIRGCRASGDAAAYGIYLYRGSTTALSSSTVTPIPVPGWTGIKASDSTVTALGSTSLPSTISAVLLDAWGSGSDGIYLWKGWGDLVIEPGQRFDVIGVYLQSASTNADIHFTMRFREIGKNAVS